ncbi:diphthine--ammonia ligase [Dehalogenimonas sp. THU2]|uniref:Dph6-related ATP pyrophosphatase n=1 Tax=Dehalogenimonas sp. THU2 TaxID=3151121 RepID=UPI00321876CA
MDVFVSWSGGKDCCLAAYRAQKQGHNIRRLASVVTEHSGEVFPHRLPPSVVNLQAEALGIPLTQMVTTVDTYNDSYSKMLQSFQSEGITGGVFGDVSIGNNLAEKHLNWAKSVCEPAGITPIMPLWNEERSSLLRDLVDSGFTAMIIVVGDSHLGKEWLGRKLDTETIAEFQSMAEASPSGHVGYYHTLVVDGPIFSKRLEITDFEPVLSYGNWFMGIKACRLVEKTDLKTKTMVTSPESP